MDHERTSPLECRMEGRTLTGTALRYGERASDRPEMFAPGAFGPLGSLALNLQHDPEREVANTADGTLRLLDSDTELRIAADLREGSAELRLVRRGALRGLSVEFRSHAEHRREGLRVVERAELVGIGLVDSGSYSGSGLELRALDEAALVSVIPFDRPMACECVGAECSAVEFAPGAFDDLGKDHDVLMIAGKASEVLGSLARGTFKVAKVTPKALELTGAALVKIETGIEIVLEKVLTAAASAVLSNSIGAPFYVRPIIRDITSEYLDLRGVRRYSRADVRAFLVKPAITDRGQIPAWIDGRKTGAIPPALVGSRLVTEERRRAWVV